VEDAQQRLLEAEQCRQEYETVRMALEAMGQTDESVQRCQKLAMEIAVQGAKLAQIAGQPLSAEEANRYTTELKNLQTSLPGWQDEERRLARESAVLEVAERDLVDLEDGVAYWRGEEERAREEERTLLLARDLLMEAGSQAHREIASPLAAHITQLFASMTGGRYPEVRVTGDASNLEIFPIDISGTPIPPDQLSRGTRDQFLLAVRMGFGRVIAGAQGTPIFLLDDPFLHFDADRRQEALTMLANYAKEAQCILATHDTTLLKEMPGAAVVHLDKRLLNACGA
jgi:recombinational DNA repair ATPase RecF